MNKKKERKKIKYTAYILSYTHGTVQIGNKVYQPYTKAIFRVQGKPKKYIAKYKTSISSIEEANRLLRKYERKN